MAWCTLEIAHAAVTTPGDLNLDSPMKAADLSLLLSLWGTADSVADIDDDGIAGASDLALLLSTWTN